LSLARRQRRLGLDVGLSWRELGEFRLGWTQESGHDSPELVTPLWEGVTGAQSWREEGVRLRAVFDQLDSAWFPTRGWRVEGQYLSGHRQVDGGTPPSEGDMSRWDMNALAVGSWGAHTLQLGARLAGGEGALPDLPRYGLGGFQQLSGYATDQLSGQQVALVRAGYAYKLGVAPLTRGLYVGGSLELGNAWQRWGEVGQGHWRHGASLYLGADTAFGPVYAAVGSAEGVRPTLMIFVGRP
jgi:NTE family protein